MTEQTQAAPENQAQPQEEPRRPLSQLAQEVFGSAFQPSDDAAGGDGDEAEDPGITIDEAYDRLQAGKDEAAAAPAAQPEPEAAPAPEPQADPGDEAVWSAEDVATIREFHSQADAWRQDAAQFAAIKDKLDINAIAQTDKARAAALRTQLSEAEKELRQRYDVLSQTEQALVGRRDARQQSKASQHLEGERKKLERALPDFDKDAVRGYLQSYYGFGAKELDNVADHRLLVISEKARRYDEMKARGPGKVPKLRRGAGQRGQQPDAGPPVKDFQGRQMPLSALQAQVKRHGRLEDAAALLTAKRRAAQQQPRRTR